MLNTNQYYNRDLSWLRFTDKGVFYSLRIFCTVFFKTALHRPMLHKLQEPLDC